MQVPLAQNAKQINTAFEAFLDIIKLQMDYAAELGLPQQHAEDARSFLRASALQLLSSGKAS